jgi:hypothetical protein
MPPCQEQQPCWAKITDTSKKKKIAANNKKLVKRRKKDIKK